MWSEEVLVVVWKMEGKVKAGELLTMKMIEFESRVACHMRDQKVF